MELIPVLKVKLDNMELCELRGHIDEWVTLYGLGARLSSSEEIVLSTSKDEEEDKAIHMNNLARKYDLVDNPKLKDLYEMIYVEEKGDRKNIDYLFSKFYNLLL